MASRISEIENLFSQTVRLTPDPTHSLREERVKAFGKTAEGRALLVVFTMRRSAEKALLIRPISARYMHAKEASWYEKEIAEPRK